MMANSNQPLVSVCIITYNHEKYIEQCLDSIVSQRTEFSFEIVIRDDGSNDRTLKIIELYQKRYPHLFNVLDSKVNLGANKNILQVFSACAGKYVAICEGDDFWVDEFKLHKQVRLLECNLDCSLLIHPCYEVNGLSKKIGYLKSKSKFTAQDIVDVSGQFAPSASYFFRSTVLNDIPAWFSDLPIGDFFIELYAQKSGLCLYNADVVCAYRTFSSGSWSDDIRTGKHLLFIERYKLILEALEFAKADFRIDFSKKESSLNVSIAYLMLLARNYKGFYEYLTIANAIKTDVTTTQKLMSYMISFPRFLRLLFLCKYKVFNFLRLR
ncbi:glycosyltransferase [Shewanella algae]|uniref:glycosyltransferase n=1 Tax=Shewanella algae TaxID=38313 RepID=UPI0027243484|nr:glycosyltransferase [Shewanella algae]MDO8254150.1 glycosyltransferase [Shewanella algae]